MRLGECDGVLVWWAAGNLQRQLNEWEQALTQVCVDVTA
jgi:hypothetical protein